MIQLQLASVCFKSSLPHDLNVKLESKNHCPRVSFSLRAFSSRFSIFLVFLLLKKHMGVTVVTLLTPLHIIQDPRALLSLSKKRHIWGSWSPAIHSSSSESLSYWSFPLSKFGCQSVTTSVLVDMSNPLSSLDILHAKTLHFLSSLAFWGKRQGERKMPEPAVTITRHLIPRLPCTSSTLKNADMFWQGTILSPFLN